MTPIPQTESATLVEPDLKRLELRQLENTSLNFSEKTKYQKYQKYKNKYMNLRTISR